MPRVGRLICRAKIQHTPDRQRGTAADFRLDEDFVASGFPELRPG